MTSIFADPPTLTCLPSSLIRLIAFHLLLNPINQSSIPLAPLFGPVTPAPFLVPNPGSLKGLLLTCRKTYEALRLARLEEVAEVSVKNEERVMKIGNKRKRSRSRGRGGERKDDGNPMEVPQFVIDPALLGETAFGTIAEISSASSTPNDPPQSPSSDPRLGDFLSSPLHFYRYLYTQTFDTTAVIRRWGTETTIPSVQFRSRRSSASSSVFSHLSPSSSSSTSTAIEPQTLDLLKHPFFLANEYKERMMLFRRMRYVGVYKSMEVIVNHPNGEREVVCTRSHVVQDLWRIWWMITEHDDRNIHLLTTMANMIPYLQIYYHQIHLPGCMKPGYAPSSVEGGLFTWITVRTMLDKGLENTSDLLDEKLFVYKPSVFACFQYPHLLGPWLFRHLPLTDVARSHEELDLISGPNPFMSKLTPKVMSGKVTRFGMTWEMVPPNHSEAASFILARMLDRQPHLSTLHKNEESKTRGLPPLPRDRQLSIHFQIASASSPPGSGSAVGPASSPSQPRSNERKRSSLTDTGSSSSTTGSTGSGRKDVVVSIDFDDDHQRSLTCLNPIDSPGLPPLFFRHKLQGLWVGKYLYLDHSAYQASLGGDIRSMYEGSIGDEEQEFYLEESVINVKIDRVGGDGPALAAGFKVDMDDDELLEDQQMDVDQRGWEPCLDENEPDKPGWTKEIILSGKGRSGWGPCNIYGRVRGWDGLITWRTDYGHLTVSKWLWRGYVHAGGMMVGRFRDCFTPENLRAYEGPMTMLKVDGALHAERQREKLSTWRHPYRQDKESHLRQLGDVFRHRSAAGLPLRSPPQAMSSPVGQVSSQAQAQVQVQVHTLNGRHQSHPQQQHSQSHPQQHNSLQHPPQTREHSQGSGNLPTLNRAFDFPQIIQTRKPTLPPISELTRHPMSLPPPMTSRINRLSMIPSLSVSAQQQQQQQGQQQHLPLALPVPRTKSSVAALMDADDEPDIVKVNDKEKEMVKENDQVRMTRSGRDRDSLWGLDKADERPEEDEREVKRVRR